MASVSRALRPVGARQQLVQRHGDQVGGLGHPLAPGPHQLNSAGSTPGRAARAHDDLLDPQARGLQPGLAVRLQGRAALVHADRILQRRLAGLQPRDDLLELGQRLFEGQGRRCRRARTWATL